MLSFTQLRYRNRFRAKGFTFGYIGKIQLKLVHSQRYRSATPQQNLGWGKHRRAVRIEIVSETVKMYFFTQGVCFKILKRKKLLGQNPEEHQKLKKGQGKKPEDDRRNNWETEENKKFRY